MKNAKIFHGTSGTPEHFWFPYVKDQLEQQGYDVWLPQLPDADEPDLAKQLPFVLENSSFDSDTILIGHSSGCPLILSVLENIDVQIHQAILVAGFTQPLSNDPEPVLQDDYDWKKIKKSCKHFVFINSDNDPWGCDDKAGRILYDHLGGTLVIRHGEGHMGSDKFNQPYKEFPLIPALIHIQA